MGFDLEGRRISNFNKMLYIDYSGSESFTDFVNDTSLIDEEYRALKEEIGEIHLIYWSDVSDREGTNPNLSNRVIDFYFELGYLIV